MVNALYDFGNFQYSCGTYGAAAELLYQFRVLSTDNDKVAAATWGKLASEILTTNWESAMEELLKVKESIDTKLFNNPLAQLQQRTWLIHWALFPLFNYEGSRDQILELFFSPNFINTIQTSCPWILRNHTTAINSGRSRVKNTGIHQKQQKNNNQNNKQKTNKNTNPNTKNKRALYL